MKVAVVKAGPHALPWIQRASQMDSEMPEGHLVLIKAWLNDWAQVMCLESDIKGQCGWFVNSSSLQIIGDL